MRLRAILGLAHRRMAIQLGMRLAWNRRKTHPLR